MNWENYRKLTPTQKEEYNYKFKETPQPPFQSWLTFGLILWFGFSQATLVMYLVYTSSDPSLLPLKPRIDILIQQFTSMSRLFLKGTMALTLIWIIQITWHIYSEKQWRKQNGVTK